MGTAARKTACPENTIVWGWGGGEQLLAEPFGDHELSPRAARPRAGAGGGAGILGVRGGEGEEAAGPAPAHLLLLRLSLAPAVVPDEWGHAQSSAPSLAALPVPPGGVHPVQDEALGSALRAPFLGENFSFPVPSPGAGEQRGSDGAAGTLGHISSCPNAPEQCPEVSQG